MLEPRPTNPNYQAHNIPLESIFDPQEERSLHLAIIKRLSDRILAYGQLRQNSPDRYAPYQNAKADRSVVF
jgi:hypothetical protein